MAAELAAEFLFPPEYGDGPVVIPSHELQKTDVFHGKTSLGRHRSVHWTVEMPLEHVSSEIAFVDVNGYGASQETYTPSRRARAQLGQIAVTLGLYQDFPWLGVPSLRDLRHTEEIRQEAVVAALDGVDDRFDTDLLYHLLGHSTGGRTSTGVAEGVPERIAGVTYTHSAAVVEGQNTGSFIGRFPRFTQDEIVANWETLKHHYNRPSVLGDLLWYNFGNSLFSGAELMDISNADICDRIIALKGIVKTAILDGKSDRLTPNTSVEAELGQHVDHYQLHPHPMIGHLGPQVFPVETAMEHHHIAEVLYPGRVFAPREFSVVSLAQHRKGQHVPVAVTEVDLAAAS